VTKTVEETWDAVRAPKPDTMVTLTCSSCRMALYMAERRLEMATWTCPSCGAITKTKP
jgi:predicted RNA-binding Zn-ribbon protein involved in translation (DUF1610 family)